MLANRSHTLIPLAENDVMGRLSLCNIVFAKASREGRQIQIQFFTIIRVSGDVLLGFVTSAARNFLLFSPLLVKYILLVLHFTNNY
jgi:hypothetical protein